MMHWSHTKWKVLQYETGSLNGRGCRWFRRRSTGEKRRVTEDMMMMMMMMTVTTTQNRKALNTIKQNLGHS